MSNYTSYLEVTEKIADAMTTALAGSPTKVFRGLKMDRNGPEYVAIGGIEDGNHEWATMKPGRKPMNESYLLIVNINVQIGGSDSLNAETRCIEIWEMLVDYVTGNPNLGLNPPWPSLRASMEKYEMDTVSDGARQGWRSLLVAKVLVENRISNHV